jgi:hypothetical protein
MKSFLKITLATILFFFGFSFAFAQAIEPIKTDDVLKWRNVTLTSVGQNITDGPVSVFSSSVKIDPVTGERSYFSKEEVVLRMNYLFASLQKGKRTLKSEEVYALLPQKLAVGEKWKYVAYENSSRCGVIRLDYEATVIQGPDVLISIKGLPNTVKTLQINHEGTWYTSSCGGSGRELNELAQYEVHYYEKSFLYNGRKVVLDSVN